ncbi:MAG: alpha-L-fucosidase, partial [Bacteroidales bacterium]|nr:alpha-L-fucosidase [Bacteroidales bacterium]
MSIQAQKHPPQPKPAAPPKPYGPVPTTAQVAWQRMEMNMFCHFGPNTFTGLEWGEGTEAEDIFNPTALNCDQWVEVAKKAGFQGIILTAKHHDGFCLWPNPMSTHTVRESAWRSRPVFAASSSPPNTTTASACGPTRRAHIPCERACGATEKATCCASC